MEREDINPLKLFLAKGELQNYTYFCYYCLSHWKEKKVHTSGQAAIGSVTQCMNMKAMLAWLQSFNLSCHRCRACKVQHHQQQRSQILICL
jgi:hypothetical protein